MDRLTPVSEALERILAMMTPVGRETVPLPQAGGRVLAENVVAQRTQPPFPASSMDGYALRAAEATPGAEFEIAGEAAAGHPFAGEIPPGHALRIFTGAPVPAGLDRVVIQEDVARSGSRIRLSEPLDAGPHIRPAGLDFRAGETLLKAPRRLSPEDIALLAAAGVPFVSAHRRPRVALIATGDELVLPGMPAPDGHIVSSNNFGLAALIELHGGEPILLPLAADTEEALRRAGQEARGADLIVTLGGASVGDHDLIRPALENHGLELDLYRIAMRPGKPLMAGRLAGTPMLGLPGNPVSAMVCGRLFLVPALTTLSGLPAGATETVEARLSIDLSPNGPREHYMRARCWREQGTLFCTPFESQDSARLGLLADANALAIRPAHDPARTRGEPIRIIPLRDIS